MNFIDRCSTFCIRFYVVILSLTIPYYLLLYGASGHEFNPTTEDITWVTVVFIALVTAIANLALKEKVGLLFNAIRVLFSITLLLATYGGLKAFLFIVQFDYGDDTGIIFRGITYLIPLLFTFSSIIILIGLFTKKAE